MGFFLVLAAATQVQLQTANPSVACPLDVLYEEPFSDLCADKLLQPNPIFISGGLFLKGKLLQRGTSLSSPSCGQERPEPRQKFFYHVFRPLILTFPGAFKENPGIMQKMHVFGKLGRS